MAIMVNIMAILFVIGFFVFIFGYGIDNDAVAYVGALMMMPMLLFALVTGLVIFLENVKGGC